MERTHKSKRKHMNREVDVSTNKTKAWGDPRQTLLLRHLSRVASKRPRIETPSAHPATPRELLNTLTSISPRGDASSNQLPPEVLINIFLHLSVKDVVSAMRVCSSWYPVASTSFFSLAILPALTGSPDDNQLWHTLCKRTLTVNWTEEQMKNCQYNWKDYFKDLKNREDDLSQSYYLVSKPVVEPTTALIQRLTPNSKGWRGQANTGGWGKSVWLPSL